MCVDGAGVEENAVFELYGCWRDFYLWGWQAYGLTDDSWDPAGISDACNVALPFAKVLNSVFLINFALSDNHDLQWHSTEDYESSSRAGHNRFHDSYYQRFIEYDGSAFATTYPGDRTDLHCPLFNHGAFYATATSRAGTMIHESWHHWQDRHGFVSSHPLCAGGNQCDYYYFHGVGDYEFGALDGWDTDSAHFRFHSPRQVQVEFLADLAEMSHPWIPTSVTTMARNYGNLRLANEFVNAVAYRIGDPRPW
jgi:hypothetical protein